MDFSIQRAEGWALNGSDPNDFKHESNIKKTLATSAEQTLIIIYQHLKLC